MKIETTFNDFSTTDDFSAAVSDYLMPHIGMWDLLGMVSWDEKESAIYDWIADGYFTSEETVSGIAKEFEERWNEFESMNQ